MWGLSLVGFAMSGPRFAFFLFVVTRVVSDRFVLPEDTDKLAAVAGERRCGFISRCEDPARNERRRPMLVFVH